MSAKRTAWNEFSCFIASAVICLATGRKSNFSKYIFDSMIRNVDSPSKFMMYPRFLQVLINNQIDDLSSHTTKYTSPTLTQNIFANMRKIGKGFFGLETPLFATMLVQPQATAEEEDEEDDVPNAPTPPQEQPTTTSASDMTLLNTLMETCTTLSHKVAALEQDKVAQALEIIKLKQRVKRLEKKRRSKSSSLKRLRKVDDDEDITLVDMEIEVDLDAELKGRIERKYDDNADIKKVNAAEPTEIPKSKEETTVAQAKKNMIVYLKNIARYKIAHFKGMTYDQVRPIFEREYNKVQTFLKPDRDEEPTKKRVSKETLLQESFKKLRAEFEVLVAEFKVEALQVKEDLDALWRLVKEKFSTTMPTEDKGKALWVELKRLYEPNAADVFWKLQRYMHDPLTWKLYTNYEVHQVSSTRRHGTDAVLLLMLSTQLQVDEDYEMARDLMMKIFMEANKPKSKRSLDTSSK
nr:hypothetical protein [Tanacetum cinerariifolium]